MEVTAVVAVGAIGAAAATELRRRPGKCLAGVNFTTMYRAYTVIITMQFMTVTLLRMDMYHMSSIATAVNERSLRIVSFWWWVTAMSVLAIMRKMEPSTTHRMIPHAPSTSPTDSAAAVGSGDDVQLTRFEKRSGEELHHESNTAISAPVLRTCVCVGNRSA